MGSLLFMALFITPMTDVQVFEAIRDCRRGGGEPSVVYGGRTDGGSVSYVECFTSTGRYIIMAPVAPTADKETLTTNIKEAERRRCQLTGSRFVEDAAGYRCVGRPPADTNLRSFRRFP